MEFGEVSLRIGGNWCNIDRISNINRKFFIPGNVSIAWYKTGFCGCKR